MRVEGIDDWTILYSAMPHTIGKAVDDLRFFTHKGYDHFVWIDD